MPVIQRPTDFAQFIGSTLKEFDELGFADALPKTRALMQEWRRTAAALRAPDVRLVDTYAYTQVYKGQMSAEAALARVDAAEAAAAQVAQRKRDGRFDLAAQRLPLWNTFCEETELWLPSGQQRFVETLARFEAAVAAIPADVDSDSRAMKRGGTAMQAWSDACRSLELLERLHTVAANLRAASALSVAGGKQFGFSPREYCWLEPDRVPQWSRGAPHRVLQMQFTIRQGAGPCMLSAVQLEALAEADKRRVMDEERAKRQPRRTPVMSRVAHAPVQEGT